jgi:sarcosine oxidase
VIEVQAVVIGAGVMGAATAKELSERGRDVLVLEKFKLGHKNGSSHGNARIFRLSYPQPHYVRLAQEALALWRQLEEESGQSILKTTGGLDVGPGAHGHAEALKSCGVEFELLDHAEVAARFPNLTVPDWPVLFQPDAGTVNADLAVSTFITIARRNGAELRENAPARSIHQTEDRVRVETEDDVYSAEVAIVTSGAWAKPLLAGAGIDLPVTVTRETVTFFELAEELTYPTVVDWAIPPFYALPSPGDGLKVGEHHAGPVTDADTAGEVDEASVARLAEFVRGRYPKAAATPHRAETCLYTNTADARFILERHGRTVVGSPCSGHGFKFAPAIGRQLAELACEVI